MRSIRRTLLAGMTTAILVVLAVTMLFVYRETRAQIDSLLDAHLRQIVRSVPAPGSRLAYGTPFADLQDTPDLLIQVWDRDGGRIYASSTRWRLPAHARLGFADAPTPDGRVRVFSELRDGLLVQAAQPLSLRRTIAAEAALRQVLPLLALGAVLLLLAWVIVGRGLSPLANIRRDLAARDRGSLQALERGGLPRELDPLVAEINALLGRLDAVLQRQQAFVADAAHELRTPLAALRLQIDSLALARAPDDDARDARDARDDALARLRAGVARMARLVDQLLTLARQEHAGAAAANERIVDLSALARQVVAMQAESAASRDIDLGLEGADDETGSVLARGDADAIETQLANLIANAIRHVPHGGRVDVRALALDGRPTLIVDDNGPGIAPAARERVFDRFYRAPGADGVGSGLGLAIVREIATRHGARVELTDSPLGGLRVVVSFAPMGPGRSPAPAAGRP